MLHNQSEFRNSMLIEVSKDGAGIGPCRYPNRCHGLMQRSPFVIWIAAWNWWKPSIMVEICHVIVSRIWEGLDWASIHWSGVLRCLCSAGVGALSSEPLYTKRARAQSLPPLSDPSIVLRPTIWQNKRNHNWTLFEI
jgi:hypothetical protein